MNEKIFNIHKQITAFNEEIRELNNVKSKMIYGSEGIQALIDICYLEINKLNDKTCEIVEEENLKESNLNHERIKQNKILSLRVQLYALSNAKDENQYFLELVRTSLRTQKCCEGCSGWYPGKNTCECGTEWHFEMNEQTGKLYAKKY